MADTEVVEDAAVVHRRSELSFRSRIWHEAGANLDQAARSLLCALFTAHYPQITRIVLDGEYNEDGELHLNLDTAYEGDEPVGEDERDAIEDHLGPEGMYECLMQMTAGTGEDYLSTHEIDITEEGRYA